MIPLDIDKLKQQQKKKKKRKWGCNITHRAHDVYATSPQRRCNVMASSRKKKKKNTSNATKADALISDGQDRAFDPHRLSDLSWNTCIWRCIDVEATLHKRHVPAG